MYTRCTCIHTIYTPLNILYTPSIHPKYMVQIHAAAGCAERAGEADEGRARHAAEQNRRHRIHRGGRQAEGYGTTEAEVEGEAAEAGGDGE